MYCTVQDILDLMSFQRLVQLTDDEHSYSDSDGQTLPATAQKRVDTAISSADNIIDAFLSARYSTPLKNVPDAVKNISANLAFCYLQKRAHDTNLPEGIEFRENGQMKLLRDYQAGRAKLPGFDGEPQRTFLSSKNESSFEFGDKLLGMY